MLRRERTAHLFDATATTSHCDEHHVALKRHGTDSLVSGSGNRRALVSAFRPTLLVMRFSEAIRPDQHAPAHGRVRRPLNVSECASEARANGCFGMRIQPVDEPVRADFVAATLFVGAFAGSSSM